MPKSCPFFGNCYYVQERFSPTSVRRFSLATDSFRYEKCAALQPLLTNSVSNTNSTSKNNHPSWTRRIMQRISSVVISFTLYGEHPFTTKELLVFAYGFAMKRHFLSPYLDWFFLSRQTQHRTQRELKQSSCIARKLLPLGR